MPTDANMSAEKLKKDGKGCSGKPEEQVVTATMETESAKGAEWLKSEREGH